MGLAIGCLSVIDVGAQATPVAGAQRVVHEPFWSAPALGAVALFVVNNVWLKWRYPGWWTGKLSDLCACFFLPLYVGWLLTLVGSQRGSSAQRIRIGALVTIGVFVSVKATQLGATVLNTSIAWLTQPTGLQLAHNRADVTDLIALPMVWVALRFANAPIGEVATSRARDR